MVKIAYWPLVGTSLNVYIQKMSQQYLTEKHLVSTSPLGRIQILIQFLLLRHVVAL